MKKNVLIIFEEKNVLNFIIFCYNLFVVGNVFSCSFIIFSQICVQIFLIKEENILVIQFFIEMYFFIYF